MLNVKLTEIKEVHEVKTDKTLLVKATFISGKDLYKARRNNCKINNI